MIIDYYWLLPVLIIIDYYWLLLILIDYYWLLLIIIDIIVHSYDRMYMCRVQTNDGTVMDVMKHYGWPSVGWCLYLRQRFQAQTKWQWDMRGTPTGQETGSPWWFTHKQKRIWCRTANKPTPCVSKPSILSLKRCEMIAPVSHHLSPWLYTLWILAQLRNWRQASSLVMLPVAWKSKPRNKARVAVKPFLTWVPLRGRTVSVLRVIIYIYTFKKQGVQKVFVPQKGTKKTRVFTKFLGDSEWMASLILTI